MAITQLILNILLFLGTLYSGHYTAYCKNPRTSEWHYFNDSRLFHFIKKNALQKYDKKSESYLSIYVSIYLSIFMDLLKYLIFIHLFIYLFSIYLIIYLSIHIYSTDCPKKSLIRIFRKEWLIYQNCL